VIEQSHVAVAEKKGNMRFRLRSRLLNCPVIVYKVSYEIGTTRSNTKISHRNANTD
jgi:hypothetical protein